MPSYATISPEKKAKKARTSTMVDYSSQIAKIENKNRELEASLMQYMRNQDDL
jgi:hypothetical protein